MSSDCQLRPNHPTLPIWILKDLFGCGFVNIFWFLPSFTSERLFMLLASVVQVTHTTLSEASRVSLGSWQLQDINQATIYYLTTSYGNIPN